MKKQKEAEFRELDERLRRDGVDTSLIAFYDQARFVAQEKLNPEYMKLLARWLARRQITESYRRRAERAVPAIASRVAEVYAGSGMVAACFNGSSMLSRVLERAGIWNHVIHGCFVLEVPSRGIWRGYQTVDAKDFPGAVCGHAWVFAPPFHVVDVTIAAQRWFPEERPFVPKVVVTQFKARMQPEISDIIAARVQPELRGRASWGKKDLIYEVEPGLREMEGYIAPMGLTVGEARLRYVPIAVRLPDVDLEPMNSGEGCTGPTGTELWNQCAELVAQLAQDY